MALFENFPYTNLQDINLKCLIDTINSIKEGQVISVNGKTGEVTLYEAASVQFPDVSGDVWNIVRNANGHRVGIAFHDDGMAYILHDGYQFQIYNSQNPPPYPVTSVNGQTGNIILYSGASVELPALDDQQLLSWRIFRDINGTTRGIKFDTDGKAYVMDGTPGNDQIYTIKNPPFDGDMEIHFPSYDDVNGHSYLIGRYFNNNWLGFKIYDDGHVSIMTDDNTEIPLYVQGVTSPSDFTDPSAAVLELVNVLPLGSTEWGIIRNISGADVGLLFKYNSITLEWELYKKANNTLDKLLTLADIPAGSGVVSINNKTGAVTLYGTDIELAQGFGETVKQAIDSLRAETTCIESGIAIVADGNTHGAINKNDFVYVKNNQTLAEGLYKATQQIAANAVIDNINVSPSASNVLSSRSRAYAPDQSVNQTFMCFGVVTSNALNLSLFVPMLVADTVERVTIDSAKISLRAPAGGYIGAFQLEVKTLIDSISILPQGAGLRISITNNTAFANAVNTTPIAGVIELNMSFHNV